MANPNHSRNLFESALRQVHQNEKAITNNIALYHELTEEKKQLTEIVGTLITAGLLAAAAAPIAGVAADMYAHRKEKQRKAAEAAQKQSNIDREHGFNVQRHQEDIGERRTDRQSRENTAAEERKARQDEADKARKETRRGAKKNRQHAQLLLSKKNKAALRTAQIRYGSGGTP